jgi:UDP-3-O-[3-hydroxymyristoyl] glucosamine N-acyltransferase
LAIIPSNRLAKRCAEQRLKPRTGSARRIQKSSDLAFVVDAKFVTALESTKAGAHAVIGEHVRIGSNCAIGASCTLTHAHLGDNVVIHPGCHIGQDGFGYVSSAEGHIKVPQIGRVVIHNTV